MQLHRIAILLFTHIFVSSLYSQVLKQHRVSIPLYFDINDDYHEMLGLKQALVEIITAKDTLLYSSKKYKPLRRQTNPVIKITSPGTYKVRVSYYADSTLTPSTFLDSFKIAGDEIKIELNINIQWFDGNEDGLYVNKYYGNKLNVVLKRLWNPQQQFDVKRKLLPEYEWTNTYDSVIYGVHYLSSSHSMISWVSNWKIAFMEFEIFKGDNWLSANCNAPRLDAILNKGETGKTLKDMVLDCDKENYKPGDSCRILIKYGINDAIFRTTNATAMYTAHNYSEHHIYQVADEFRLK